jgi:hypothetical protein
MAFPRVDDQIKVTRESIGNLPITLMPICFPANSKRFIEDFDAPESLRMRPDQQVPVRVKIVTVNFDSRTQ